MLIKTMLYSSQDLWIQGSNVPTIQNVSFREVNLFHIELVLDVRGKGSYKVYATALACDRKKNR